MTDDLKARLRSAADRAKFLPHLHHEAADRIIELEADNEVLSDRIATLEAALADMTQQRDAAMAGAVKVKPLIWKPLNEGYIADDPLFGRAVVALFPEDDDDERAARILSALTPDPDRLLALTAAAYQNAGKALDFVADHWSCVHMPPHCDCWRDVEQWRLAADEVRSCASADAIAALSRIEAQAEARGMRKAADLSQKNGDWIYFKDILELADATEAAAKGGV